MKRFLVALAFMIGTLFIFSITYSNNEILEEKESIYVVNSEFETIRFANNNNEIPLIIKNEMDFLCEVDGVKYYRID